jgi:hypothetical protein
MKHSPLTSRLNSLLCPWCEVSTLYPPNRDSMRCGLCGGHLTRAMFETLRHIANLPDALGKHACECGHPEMRFLLDGVYHCPACGSEVLPIEEPTLLSEASEHSEAYRAGWMDGRFRRGGSFVDNPELARWKDPSDRLDYYKGHRAGGEDRHANNGRHPNARERLFG